MAKSKTNVRYGLPVPEQKKHCDCTDCRWARLVQYEGPREPLLAECTKKPQPYSVRFPYQVEVDRAKKVCPLYLHTDEVRTPEIRAKVRFYPMAGHVTSQQQAV